MLECWATERMRKALAVLSFGGALMLGCGGPERVAPDGAPPRCGDGVVSDGSLGPTEWCDDGSANGTELSLCFPNCTSAESSWRPIEADTTVLPFPAKKLIPSWDHLVISNFDDQGIALVPIRNSGPPVLLKRYGAPVDFEVPAGLPGSTSSSVMWLERAVPGVGGPWLLWANASEDPAPTIHVLPFPTDTRGDPVFVRHDWGHNGIVTVDANGHLLFILVQDLSQNLVRLTDLGPAPSGILRRAAHTRNWARTAIFFEDGPITTIVTLSGSWPEPPSVDSQTIWNGFIHDVAWGEWLPSLVDEVAVLGAQGEVTIISPGQDLVEAFPPVFTRIPGNVTDISDDRGNLYAMTQDGNLVWIVNNREGRGMKPQLFPIGLPCTVCTIAEQWTSPAWFALDTIAVHGQAWIGQ